MPRAKRPWTKLIPLRRKLLVESHRAGLSRELCAQRANVGKSTFMVWLHKGHDDREKGLQAWPWDPEKNEWDPSPGKGYSKELDLLTAFERAEADRITEALIGIRAAGKGGEPVTTEEVTTTAPDGTSTTVRKTRIAQPDWKALAWIAERTRPGDYGPRQEPTVTVNPTGPTSITYTFEQPKSVDAAPQWIGAPVAAPVVPKAE